jgi:hypothetical protein
MREVRMKKGLLLIILLMIPMLTGCGKEKNKFSHYLDTLKSHVEKLDSFVEEKQVNVEKGSQTNDQPVYLSHLDDSKQYRKEDFLSVYEKQKGFRIDINRTEALLLYRDLLDKVFNELNKTDVKQLDTFIEVDFNTFGEVDIYCGFTDEEEIIVKLIYKNEAYTTFTALKSGYQDKQFYIKEMNYYAFESDINYLYSEFHENDHYVSLNYNDNENFIFEYHSVTENIEFTLNKGSGVIEAEEPVSGYSLGWYDQASNGRYHIGLSDESKVIFEFYEIFNDHGMIFSYEDLDTRNDEISVTWNMLEATGWDYAYISDNVSNNPINSEDGIYKNDVKLFVEDRFYAGLNENYATLRIKKDFTIDELTTEKLNLSEFGLSFSLTELDLASIAALRNRAIEGAKDTSFFHNINLFDDQIVDEFLSVIDQDLIFNDVKYKE